MVVRQLQRALSQPNLVWVGMYTGSGHQWLDKVIDHKLHASLEHAFDSWTITYKSLCEFERGLSDTDTFASVGRTILPYTNGVTPMWLDMTKHWLDQHNLQLCATCLSILMNLEDYS